MRYLIIIICCYISSISVVYARAQQSSNKTILVQFKDSASETASTNRINFKKADLATEYLRSNFKDLKMSFKLKSIIEDDENPRSKEFKNQLGLDRTYELSVDSNTNNSKLKNLIHKFNSDPNVEYAELDALAQINAIPNDPLYTSTGSTWNFPFDEMWAAKRINIEGAWESSLGEGIVIAIIDTGVDYNHPDLWDNIWVDPKLATDLNQDGKINLDDIDSNHNHVIENSELNRNYIGYDFDGRDSIPEDYNRHGTSIAGVAAASANNSEGITGIAPKAKIMILKAINNDGSGRYSNLAQAVISAADRGAHITNSSWAGTNSRTISNAFKYAYKKGLVNIASAGNKNVDARSNSPANLSSVISVGAVEPLKDDRASFSNYGSVVDIAAPGAYVTTSLSGLNKDNAARFVGEAPYQYWYVSGTSIASPHVAGVVALMLSENPKLSNEEIKALLISSSERLNTDQNIGGLVDAAAAVAAAKAAK